MVECYCEDESQEDTENRTSCPETVVLNVYKRAKFSSKEQKLCYSLKLFVKEGELPEGLCICGYDEALKLQNFCDKKLTEQAKHA